MKKIAVLGSSGSIGRQALDVIGRYPAEFKVSALSVNSDVETLRLQCEAFRPRVAGIADEKAYRAAKNVVKGVELVGGKEALLLGGAADVDVALIAVAGFEGLTAVIAAVKASKTIALANKESLVAGGEKVMALALAHSSFIIPVDSEHSAVFQCLQSGRTADVKRIILTASGGAYYNYSAEQLKTVTPAQAVKHPNWRMGKKISVDSATMMNKGLELIEARWLFGTKSVDYVVHPQSVVHSMVEFNDGAIVAQLAVPDMRIPIQYALTYPQRRPSPAPFFAFDRPLTFIEPDENRFRAPLLAKSCIEKGGTAACVLNAADEAAVKLFLDGRITFDRIVPIVERALNGHNNRCEYSLDDLYGLHREIYHRVLTENLS